MINGIAVQRLHVSLYILMDLSTMCLTVKYLDCEREIQQFTKERLD